MFDPAGLIFTYTIKFKLFLRVTCLKEEIAWTDPLSPNLMNRWKAMVEELASTPPISIKRSAKSPNVQGKPRLVVFSSGSLVAYTMVMYVWSAEAYSWSV